MDAYRLANHNLLKSKKYGGLVYHDEHAIAGINQITDKMTNTKIGNRPKIPDKDSQHKTDTNYTFWGQLLKVWKIWPLRK